MSIHGYQNTRFYPMFLTATATDDLHLDNFRFMNSSISSTFMISTGFRTLTIGNPSFEESVIENISGFQENLISISSVRSVAIRNVRMTNVSAPFLKSLSFISLDNFEDTLTVLEDIHVSGCSFGNGALLITPASLDAIQMRNVTIMSSTVKPGRALFQHNILKSFVFSGLQLANVQPTQKEDEDSTIIQINSLDMEGDFNSSFQDVDISN